MTDLALSVLWFLVQGAFFIIMAVGALILASSLWAALRGKP